MRVQLNACHRRLLIELRKPLPVVLQGFTNILEFAQQLTGTTLVVTQLGGRGVVFATYLMELLGDLPDSTTQCLELRAGDGIFGQAIRGLKRTGKQRGEPDNR